MKTSFQLLLISIVAYFLITSCKKDKTPDITSPKYQTITVNTSEIIATGVSNKYGINLNAMHDNDVNRPTARPISEALIEMGVKHLRFPGGGKSNFYYWTADPDKPDPTSNYFIPGWYADASIGAGETLLNFDQFMRICTQTGAIPHVNVAINHSGDPGSSGLTVKLAVAWVKYANITKGYGVKYWELGNENMGLKLTDDSLANLYISYSKAMKAVDPSIVIMAGCNGPSVSKIIQKCGSLLDIIDAGCYPNYAWGSYNYYPNHPDNDLLSASDIQSRAQGGRKVIIYEFNAIDWAGSFGGNPWPNTNDLGHGLVVFEMVGQILTNKDLIYGNFWNTRWNSIWDNYNYNNYDALDKDNKLLAVAKPLAVWGKFIKDNMVSISRTNTIVTYACCDSNTGALNLFLSNKSTFPQTVSLAVTSTNTYSSGDIWQLKGSGPSDTSPFWGKTDNTRLTANKIDKLVLPAVSITVVSISI